MSRRLAVAVPTCLSLVACPAWADPPPREPPPKKAPVRLSIGASRETREGGKETVVTGTLTVPLDKVAARAPSRPADVPPPAVGAVEPPRPTRDELRALLRVPAAGMKRLARASWRIAGVLPEDDALDRLAHRARTSAVLPELRLRAMRSIDQSLRVLPTDDDPWRTQAYGGTGTRLEVRLTWRLDRLVFADEEVPLERLRGDRAELRMKVLARLIEAVQAWQRASAKGLDPDATAAEVLDAEAHRAAAEATLDALTDGEWSRLVPPRSEP